METIFYLLSAGTTGILIPVQPVAIVVRVSVYYVLLRTTIDDDG